MLSNVSTACLRFASSPRPKTRMLNQRAIVSPSGSASGRRSRNRCRSDMEALPSHSSLALSQFLSSSGAFAAIMKRACRRSSVPIASCSASWKAGCGILPETTFEKMHFWSCPDEVQNPSCSISLTSCCGPPRCRTSARARRRAACVFGVGTATFSASLRGRARSFAPSRCLCRKTRPPIPTRVVRKAQSKIPFVAQSTGGTIPRASSFGTGSPIGKSLPGQNHTQRVAAKRL
mmetsp:Transcript_81772/g.226531  ORF Transcript_81772/g.226531 Transcript_81772/m.226531 type:complete len:233 (-) Transcript_81772:33-731(-)